jgi:hypothetical protein
MHGLWIFIHAILELSWQPCRTKSFFGFWRLMRTNLIKMVVVLNTSTILLALPPQRAGIVLVCYILNYNKSHQLFLQKVTNDYNKKSICLQNDAKWSSDI